MLTVVRNLAIGQRFRISMGGGGNFTAWYELREKRMVGPSKYEVKCGLPARDRYYILNGDLSVEAVGDTEEWCQDCGKPHTKDGNWKCPKCGACHYAFGKHVPDEMYPLSICTKCGEGHLWD